jgi:hypothetical protein
MSLVVDMISFVVEDSWHNSSNPIDENIEIEDKD